MNTSISEIKIVTAAFVIIGNEILSGRTKDVNLSYLATALVQAGIRLDEVRVIRDDQSTIANTVKTLRSEYDYVFTSGGIGPTHDDITCDSIALSFELASEAAQIAKTPKLVTLLARHMATTTAGEAMEFEFDRKNDWDSYLKIAADKTAPLLTAYIFWFWAMINISIFMV